MNAKMLPYYGHVKNSMYCTHTRADILHITLAAHLSYLLKYCNGNEFEVSLMFYNSNLMAPEISLGYQNVWLFHSISLVQDKSKILRAI